MDGTHVKIMKQKTIANLKIGLRIIDTAINL